MGQGLAERDLTPLIVMDLNLVMNNEARNERKSIYLYLSDVSGQWVSYGHSAYALRLYVKSEGFDSLRAYSADMKLPMKR